MEYCHYDIAEHVIDMKVGQPDNSLLPLDEIRVAAAARFAHQDPLILQYGAAPGYKEFRQALAKTLEVEYKVPVDWEELFVTSGVSNGLQFICTHFTSPGDLIFAEDPTYFLALRIFSDFRLNVIQVPLDEHGLRIDAVEELIKKHGVPKFMYTIPVAQNPTGRTLPEDRKRALVALAQKHNFKVISDEVYQLLTFPSSPAPPLPMVYFDNSPERNVVLSVSSFSKCLAPGLRLGWLHGSQTMLEPIANCGVLDSSGGVNPVMSAIVHEAIDMGLQQRVLKNIRCELERRCFSLMEAVQTFLSPYGVTFERPLGGYFLLCKLPKGMHAEEFAEFVQAYDVNFLPGSAFSSSYNSFFRLSFSCYESEKNIEGVKRIAKGLKDFIKLNPQYRIVDQVAIYNSNLETMKTPFENKNEQHNSNTLLNIEDRSSTPTVEGETSEKFSSDSSSESVDCETREDFFEEHSNIVSAL